VYPDEVAAVHKGWVAFATPAGGMLRIRIYRPGESLVMAPQYVHNTYLSAGSVLMYLKFGDCRTGDWVSDPDLDKITKALSEADILRMAEAP
jgi:hypothetical protein